MTAQDYLRRERNSRFALKIGAAFAVLALVVFCLVGCESTDDKIKDEVASWHQPVSSAPRVTAEYVGDIRSDRIYLLTDRETGVVCYVVQPWRSDAGRAIWCMPPRKAQEVVP